jgi:tetratricopeptide (TPR) repeat protein
MIALVITGILIAKFYYGNINKSIDPRVVKARELYAKYDSYAQEGNYYRVFALLDSIESIYRSTKHYEGSFELGVLDNNRAAALLTISMFADSIPKEYNPYSYLTVDSLVTLAESNVLKAISVYNNLATDFSGKSQEQICEIIEQQFLDGLASIDPDLKRKYLEARSKDIEKAVLENNRRLSVCYTNLGIVFRQREQYKQAAEQYKKALELWDRNLNAENNLNVLLGKPLKKRNIIQKLFPPERNS